MGLNVHLFTIYTFKSTQKDTSYTMIPFLKRIFLQDKFILSIIFINAIIIYLQVKGFENPTINSLDVLCTCIFIVEMLVKLAELGWRGYWKDGWNKLDGILVFLSIPSLVAFFIPNNMASLSVLLVLRVLRVLRIFRMLHFFPNFAKVIKGFQVALKESYGILLSFCVIIFVFGLLNCSLFRDADPEHFETPLRSIYSVFQICTVEGWYEIPNTISTYYGHAPLLAELVRLYFCLLLIFGGIIGMSFINSIFVDAMVADNNDELLEKINQLQKSIDELKKQ